MSESTDCKKQQNCGRNFTSELKCEVQFVDASFVGGSTGDAVFE